MHQQVLPDAASRRAGSCAVRRLDGVRVRVGDVRLYFDVDGAKFVPDGPRMRERPTVILLHPGPGFDHALYKVVAGPALRQEAQVVYVDARGHGRSDRSPSELLTLDTWADDLKGLCDALGIERPIVLGLGFGSMIAARYASRHSDDLAALVLLAPLARNVPSRSVAVFDRLAGPEAGEAARLFWEHPSEHTFADYLRLCIPHVISYNLTAEVMTRTQWDFATLIDWQAGEGLTVDIRPDLARIRVPTLALAGEDDPQSPLAGAEEAVEAMPAAVVEFQRLPGVRHSIFRDSPEALQTVRAFVRKIDALEQAEPE
jgi:pimeloyl-ACP methyl ester carboxylesterase